MTQTDLALSVGYGCCSQEPFHFLGSSGVEDLAADPVVESSMVVYHHNAAEQLKAWEA